jgi:hypothetical protein
MFAIVNRIATEDGQVFESIDAARQHELLAIAKDSGASIPEFIVRNWPKILEIMTAEPGKAKPKPRKRRSDFGTKRAPKTQPC